MNGRAWTPEELALLRERYPDASACKLVPLLKRSISAIHGAAAKLGLKKSRAFLKAEFARQRRRLRKVGAAHRFKAGLVPFNKGIKGWHSGGRSAETQFKKGQVPVTYMPIGSLRLNAHGYVDLKIRDAPGAHAWRRFHVVLWEDVHGPIPAGHCLRFKDRDPLNMCVENLELIPRAENLRRNSIHHLPAPLKETINLLGQLRRRLNEKSHRRSARSSVRDVGGSAR